MLLATKLECVTDKANITPTFTLMVPLPLHSTPFHSTDITELKGAADKAKFILPLIIRTLLIPLPLHPNPPTDTTKLQGAADKAKEAGPLPTLLTLLIPLPLHHTDTLTTPGAADKAKEAGTMFNNALDSINEMFEMKQKYKDENGLSPAPPAGSSKGHKRIRNRRLVNKSYLPSQISQSKSYSYNPSPPTHTHMRSPTHTHTCDHRSMDGIPAGEPGSEVIEYETPEKVRKGRFSLIMKPQPG